MSVNIDELVTDVQTRIDKMNSKQRRARLKALRKHKGDWDIDVLLEAMVLEDDGRTSVAVAAREMLKAMADSTLPVMGRPAADAPHEVIPPTWFR